MEASVLDGVGSGFECPPSARESFGMGRHPHPHSVRLVDNRFHFRASHLGWLGIFRNDRSGSCGHELDEVGAASKLLSHGLAHLPRTVRLAHMEPKIARPGRSPR